MLEKLKSYFTYNQKERTATLILMCIIFMLIMLNMLMPYFKNTKQIDYSLFEKEIKKFEMQKGENRKSIQNPDADKQLEEYYQKPYYINERKSSMNIDQSKMMNKGKNTLIKNTILNRIDINKADSSELIKLYGIGSVFASRIIKYRNLLGGYFETCQLLEVFGMDTVRYKNILPYISVSNGELTKVNINEATFREILKHPYFSYETVKEIVNYRKMNNGFSDISELKNIPGIDSITCNKILPYLTIVTE